ncbi:UvrD-helicase domain-containing protein [Paraburkholderia kururiensis]|uniref:UvrD-helicase domain-containing protein n=1 Tax=Paraburkholderia kururiensis TaxID=984307 RepID=UPI0039A695A7
MTIPAIGEADIDRLQLEYPSLDFKHPERRAVLRATDSVDVQAAPGSGKTTLLAAKLSILARNWKHEKRGICVVSHTNVAREEIEGRLRESRHGSQLFSHPHFIGTIQTFIHKFISLPFLRSFNIDVRVIDDDECQRISELKIQANKMLRALAKHSPFAYAPALRTLRYIGPSCELSSASGELPGKSADSYAHIVALKKSLTAAGIFRYDDMFSFAQHALQRYPGLHEALGHRFPLVFIDEMQDTSDAQVELLEKAMGSSCVFQRFGDVNQRILRSGDTTAAPFPTGAPLSVSTSKRFGASIANVANSLRVFGQQIVGDNPASNIAVSLFTFSDESVKRVIPIFLGKATQLVSAGEIAKYGLKAVGARKDETTTKGSGRFIGDYMATGVVGVKPTSAQPVTLHDALRAARAAKIDRQNLAGVTQRTRTAFLFLLRDLGWPLADGVRGWRQMEAQGDAAAIRTCNALVELLLSHPAACDSERDWGNVLAALAPNLSSLIGRQVTVHELESQDMTRFTGPHASSSHASSSSASHVVEVGTIAGVKGETHAATLVLESVFKKRYDVTEALPFLCGEKSSLSVKDEPTLGRLHNLFVAATRPRQYLAFAIHRDRLAANRRRQLQSLGWSVEDVT